MNYYSLNIEKRGNDICIQHLPTLKFCAVYVCNRYHYFEKNLHLKYNLKMKVYDYNINATV